jgi:hypothetical protein
MSATGKRVDETVSLYVTELQRRHAAFDRARRAELHALKHDFIAEFVTDHVVLGDKPTFDCMLQGLLTEAERQRLETDPKFTRAWRIFVDLCWTRKLLQRAALVVGGIVLVMAGIVFFVWALPHIAGPGKTPRPY